jgi:hypothetical protein
MHTRDFDVDDHHLNIQFKTLVFRKFGSILPRRDRERLRERDLNNFWIKSNEYIFTKQTVIDCNDDGVVDGMIYDPVMVTDDNYVHLIDMMLFEHPYKFQVL